MAIPLHDGFRPTYKKTNTRGRDTLTNDRPVFDESPGSFRACFQLLLQHLTDVPHKSRSTTRCDLGAAVGEALQPGANCGIKTKHSAEVDALAFRSIFSAAAACLQPQESNRAMTRYAVFLR